MLPVAGSVLREGHTWGAARSWSPVIAIGACMLGSAAGRCTPWSRGHGILNGLIAELCGHRHLRRRHLSRHQERICQKSESICRLGSTGLLAMCGRLRMSLPPVAIVERATLHRTLDPAIMDPASIATYFSKHLL